MVELLAKKDIASQPEAKDLLGRNEIVAIMDDSPEILMILEHYLIRKGLPVITASTEEELQTLFSHHSVAILLLDIELPGRNGTEILPDLAPQYPDMGIIMITGTIDIEIALDCLRHGADDYLIKPILPSHFNHTIYQTLKKRRLAIDNRIFQEQLENTNSKMQFLHDLTLKMNSAYLNAPELDSVLFAILTGITSNDGLRFNRAFLALFNDEGTLLAGKLAIGPTSKEEAGYVWREMREKCVSLSDLLSNDTMHASSQKSPLTLAIQKIVVSATETSNLLISSCLDKQSYHILNRHVEHGYLPDDICDTLQLHDFLLVPLFSASKSLGVILADNFITGKDISADDLMALEIFANQASLAIEHSQLYRDMAIKIKELEQVTEELENNKNMLVEAERYATIGFVSAQLVHAIRNPITSIGGTARLLKKKSNDPDLMRYLEILTQESEKIEDTLTNLVSYVENSQIDKKPTSLAELLQDCLASFYPGLKKKKISVELQFAHDTTLNIDPQKIRQVFLHLLRNSLEALTDCGSLTLILTTTSHMITVIIEDSGTGIPAAGLDHAADPFFTTKTYGTGLGLTLVKQILELHDASFLMEKREPSGTRVSLFFPRNEEKEK